MRPEPPPAAGWVRDLPDPRDYAPTHPRVKDWLAAARGSDRSARPKAVDLSDDFGPVPDLCGLAAGTAAACAGLVEYFDRRAFGRTVEPAWAFLFKAARALARQAGNTPTGYRVTLKALARFGLPPADLWPPTPDRWDDDPSGFAHGFAREFADLAYVRLDHPGLRGPQLLADVRTHLAASLPVAFGVPLFDGFGAGADIPYPLRDAAPRAAQAVAAVGYDDRRRVGTEQRGAFRVRGGWGPGWGDGGYGWLPYRYVTERLAADFWLVLRPDWLSDPDFARRA